MSSIAGLSQKAEENLAAQQRLAHLYVHGKLKEQALATQESELEQEATEIEGRLSFLRVQLQQAQEDTLPVRDIEEACRLLAEGLEDLTFQEKRWVINTLVDVIYANKTHWRMEGRLPGLCGEGDFWPSTARSTTGQHGGASA